MFSYRLGTLSDLHWGFKYIFIKLKQYLNRLGPFLKLYFKYQKHVFIAI